MKLTMPAFDDLDRETLLDVASGITTLADDEHLIVDNARALEAWVTEVCTKPDVRHRMEALSQVYRNLKRVNRLPMDRPEELTRRAQAFYAYLDEPDKTEREQDKTEREQDEPVELLPVVTPGGVECFIEAVRHE